MQTDEVEFELTPGMLDTPSLLTPNIVLNAPPIKLTFNPMHTNTSNNNQSAATSNASSRRDSGISSSISSADVKVLKIEDELKQSLSEPRKPTPSPFQKISSSPHIFNLDKPPANVITTDDGTTIEIPSTADVVKELEALTNTSASEFSIKTMANDNNERETNTTTTLNGDHIRYDSPPTVNMGHLQSPKKKLLIRSQSHTETPSPIPNNNNNNNSQSHKSNNDTQNGFDDENSTDDSMNNHFTRVGDLAHPSDSNINNNQQFKPTIDNGNEQQLNFQFRPDQNGILLQTIKQQPVIPNINTNKRTFQQANTGNNSSPVTRASTIIIPPSSLNEVTSSEQSSNVKRQRTAPIPANPTVVNFRTNFPSSSSGLALSPINTLTTNGSNLNPGSDDQRKRQIRDSNREAARRCRERRRQYIEQLEGNLEQHKAQIKQLTEKLSRIERENTQLRAILSETKILHPGSRLSINESHVDYANVIAATGLDFNSESNHQTDGGTIQRNYMNRNNL